MPPTMALEDSSERRTEVAGVCTRTGVCGCRWRVSLLSMRVVRGQRRRDMARDGKATLVVDVVGGDVTEQGDVEAWPENDGLTEGLTKMMVNMANDDAGVDGDAKLQVPRGGEDTDVGTGLHLLDPCTVQGRASGSTWSSCCMLLRR